MKIYKYTELSDDGKECVKKCLDECNKSDGTCQEFYLENAFNKYKKMNCFFTAITEKERELLGFLTIYADSDTEAEISGFVMPQYRRKKIFSRLLEEAVKELKNYDYQRILFKTDEAFEDLKAVMGHYPVEVSHFEYLMEGKVSRCKEVSLKDGLCIERTKEEELPILKKIQEDAFHEPPEIAQKYVEQTFYGEKSEMFTAKYKEEPVGCLSVDRSGEDNYIYGLCVSLEFRNQGIGTRMLAEVLKMLSEESERRITLGVDLENKTALSLYESCGFSVVSKYCYYLMKL